MKATAEATANANPAFVSELAAICTLTTMSIYLMHSI